MTQTMKTTGTFAVALGTTTWKIAGAPHVGVTFGDDNGDTYRVETARLAPGQRTYSCTVVNLGTGAVITTALLYRAI